MDAPVPGGGQVSLVLYWDPSSRTECAYATAPDNQYVIYVQLQDCTSTAPGDVCTPRSMRKSDFRTTERADQAGPVLLRIPRGLGFSVAATFAGPTSSPVLGIPSSLGRPSLPDGGSRMIEQLGVWP
jgi:hypothetical protein